MSCGHCIAGIAAKTSLYFSLIYLMEDIKCKHFSYIQEDYHNAASHRFFPSVSLERLIKTMFIGSLAI